MSAAIQICEIKEQINQIGGQRLAASIFSVKTPSVYGWIYERKIPDSRLCLLEVLFPGVFKPRDVYIGAGRKEADLLGVNVAGVVAWAVRREVKAPECENLARIKAMYPEAAAALAATKPAPVN
jgi:hypothetical protein